MKKLFFIVILLLLSSCLVSQKAFDDKCCALEEEIQELFNYFMDQNFTVYENFDEKYKDYSQNHNNTMVKLTEIKNEIVKEFDKALNLTLEKLKE